MNQRFFICTLSKVIKPIRQEPSGSYRSFQELQGPSRNLHGPPGFSRRLQEPPKNLQERPGICSWILGFWDFGILGFWDSGILDSERFQHSPEHLGSSRSLQESPGAVTNLQESSRTPRRPQESPGASRNLQDPKGASWII